MTERRLTSALKVLGVIVLALFVAEDVIKILARIRAVVYILVAAVFLAYLIYPAVQWLRRRMPLIAAILVTYIAMLAAFAIVAIFIVPHIMDDVSQLVRHYPDLVNRLHSMPGSRPGACRRRATSSSCWQEPRLPSRFSLSFPC